MIRLLMGGLLLSTTMSNAAWVEDNNATALSRLHVSSNSRYLINEKGDPFLMTGDTAWSLIVQPDKADAKFYLQTRSQMGFNLVLVNLIEHEYADNAPANSDGDQPFTGKPFTTPNEAYFAHADYVINTAAQEGIYVLLAPLYLGWGCGQSGWCDKVKTASEDDMLWWGQYVGNRYKDYDDIIWLIGGDVDPTQVKRKARKVVVGIMTHDHRHLFTAHNVRGQMAIDPWPGESWLTLNDIYTDYDAFCENLKRGYDVSPVKPFFLLEAAYEHDRFKLDAQEMRSQAYWTMLSGGFGYIFGNCPLWSLGTTTASSFCTLTDWKAELDSVGSIDMIHHRNLFASREWNALEPDWSHAVVTSGYGTFGQSNYVTAAMTADQSTMIAYVPTQRTITVNTGAMSGCSIRSWWFNPRDGTAIDHGMTTRLRSRTYTTPTTSGPDWVLVIDDGSKEYPPPGMAVSDYYGEQGLLNINQP